MDAELQLLHSLVHISYMHFGTHILCTILR